MRGVNKVILLGNVGQDPETRYMPNGKAVTNVRLATSEKWRDKQTGEDREATEWHGLVFYDRPAEVIAEYVRKGSQLFVEGKIKTRKWQDKEGRDRYTTEIHVHEFQLIGGNQQRTQGNGQQQQRQAPPAQQRQAPPPQGQPQGRWGDAPAPQQGRLPTGGGNSDSPFDDDIPF